MLTLAFFLLPARERKKPTVRMVLNRRRRSLKSAINCVIFLPFSSSPPCAFSSPKPQDKGEHHLTLLPHIRKENVERRSSIWAKVGRIQEETGCHKDRGRDIGLEEDEGTFEIDTWAGLAWQSDQEEEDDTYRMHRGFPTLG